MKTTASKSPLRLASIAPPEQPDKKRKKISRATLSNLLNRINFRDGDITIHFKHSKYNHTITIQAKPQICNNDYLRCLWSEHFQAENRLKHFSFIYFTFSDGLHQVLVEGKLIETNERGVYLELPESSYEMKFREIKRYQCKGITAQVIQNGKITEANLTSFSAQSFALSLQPSRSGYDFIFSPDKPISVVIKNDTDFIFSGTCEIIRQNASAKALTIICKALSTNTPLFKPKEKRSERVILSPLPSIFFRHPLTQKNIHLSIDNISGTGFAVTEDNDHAVLMPGMRIPSLNIEFVHGFSVCCEAQVIYLNPSEEGVRCGIAILDMNMKDHIKLSSYLHQAKNKHSSISTTNVDQDALWDFFFESGFIYPEKYTHIIEQKKRFKELYNKLYNNCPNIARHIIYEDHGKIYGHVAIFRFYQRTWIMHHLAAIKSTKHKAGLVVLEHLVQYINELHTLPSAKMNYLGGYFSPKNRFSSRLFGWTDDQTISSVDEFAYFYIQTDSVIEALPPSWILCESSADDLEIFNHWYNEISGGLLTKALDLESDTFDSDKSLSVDYHEAGFIREKKIFTLKNDEEIYAIITINVSDIGLNMSSLTNCIQIFILNQKIINNEIINFAFSQLTKNFENDNFPILMYPKICAEINNFPCDKSYILGIMNLDYSDEYIKYLESLTTPRKPHKINQANQAP